MSRPSGAAIGFLHAGRESRDAARAALAARALDGSVVHVIEPAAGESGYPQLLAKVQELAQVAERIVLGCSAHDASAAWLREDTGVPVQRSDAAAVRALLGTSGSIGILAGPEAGPHLADYVSEVLAQAEQPREICCSSGIVALRDCAVLFVPDFASEEKIGVLRAAWGAKPLIGALQATVAEMAGARA